MKHEINLSRSVKEESTNHVEHYAYIQIRLDFLMFVTQISQDDLQNHSQNCINNEEPTSLGCSITQISQKRYQQGIGKSLRKKLHEIVYEKQ